MKMIRTEIHTGVLNQELDVDGGVLLFFHCVQPMIDRVSCFFPFFSPLLSLVLVTRWSIEWINIE
jgi:hypothetical protein